MPNRYLNAASGFMELGLFEDAWEELETLPPDLRASEPVIGMRLEILFGLKQWESARVLAESMAAKFPEVSDWWWRWAYAIRREKSVHDARAVLRQAFQLHPTVPIIAYNLACYACVLGDVDEATGLLALVFAHDASFKAMALDDPDLAAIFGPQSSKSGEIPD